MRVEPLSDNGPKKEREKQPRRRWQWLRDAFSMEQFHEPLTDEEIALLDKIAVKIVKRGMLVPAILFLETVHPLNFVGSQAMAFLEPMVTAVFSAEEYVTFRKILERRSGIETLIERIEANGGARDPEKKSPAEPEHSEGPEESES